MVTSLLVGNVDESKYFIDIVKEQPAPVEPKKKPKQLPKPRKTPLEIKTLETDFPKDIFHEIDVTLEDIEKYVKYIDTPIIGTKKSSKNHKSVGCKVFFILFVRLQKIEYRMGNW